MRSLKTPALLATLGLCGLGSALAQGPILSVDGNSTGVMSSPQITAPTPAEFGPTPDNSPQVDSSGFNSGVIQGPEIMDHSAMNSTPMSGACGGCGNPAPQVSVAPCQSGCSTPASNCGCQSGCGGANGFNQYGGASFGSSYPIGSGSGVSSGILTPASNSGGLHTRYPYYNYRAPWFYQGPPSQNVTIIW